MNLTGQDWETVVFHQKKPSGPRVAPKNRPGAHAETETRVSGEARAASDRARKLEDETAPLYILPPAARAEMVKARTDKKLTQAQLAQQMNAKQTLIHSLESGKAIQEGPKVLVTINRILGTHLRFPSGT